MSEYVFSCLSVDVNRISFVVTSTCKGVMSLDVFPTCMLSVAVAHFHLLVSVRMGVVSVDASLSCFTVISCGSGLATHTWWQQWCRISV